LLFGLVRALAPESGDSRRPYESHGTSSRFLRVPCHIPAAAAPKNRRQSRRAPLRRVVQRQSIFVELADAQSL